MLWLRISYKYQPLSSGFRCMQLLYSERAQVSEPYTNMLTKFSTLRGKDSVVVEDRLKRFRSSVSLVRRNCIDEWLFF